MKRHSLIAGLLITCLAICTNSTSFAAPATDAPTAIYYNGTVITVDKNMSYAEAVAVKGDKIMAVGSMGDILRLGRAGTQMINLQRKTMLPGFYDPHGHFGGPYWRWVNCGSGPFGPIKDIPSLIAALKARADVTPAGQVVMGWGYDDGYMTEGRHPTRLDLDQASTKHPIVIFHFSGHTMVLNTYAVQASGVAQNNPTPGIGRFPNDGTANANTLNGQFSEGAMYLVYSFVPSESVADVKDDIAFYSNFYASRGTTTANNGGPNAASTFDIYVAAANEGKLKIRTNLWFSLAGAQTVHPVVNSDGSRTLPKYAGKNNLVVANGIKYVYDGSPQLRTAYMTDPYLPAAGFPADWVGNVGYNYATLLKTVVDSHEAGFNQIHVHGNGDHAIDDILNAYAEVRKPGHRVSSDLRHTIIHCQFNREDQLDRMLELGVIPAFFPLHTYYLGDRHRDLYMGPERAHRMSACQDAVDRKLPFTIHSDSPVMEHNPLLVMWSAVNRISYSGKPIYTLHYATPNDGYMAYRFRTQDQRVDPEDALRASTIYAAHQENEDKITGSIEVGKKADFVLLSDDPLKVDPIKIRDLQVLETIVGGETVFKAEGTWVPGKKILQ